MANELSLDRTLDGGLASVSSCAGLPQSGADGMAETLSSDPRGPRVSSPSAVSVNPVPGWERYEFLGLLGRGGMGAVYKGRDRRLGRIVALKFIRGDDETMIERFLQEARAQSHIEHPYVCKVFEVGEVEGKPYIAMQLVDGVALDRAGHSLSVTEKVRLVRDVALALHAAHEQGIVHRDIKPRSVGIEGRLWGGVPRGLGGRDLGLGQKGRCGA